MQDFIARCPHCTSANVTPNEKSWHCNDCGKDFQEAAVETVSNEPPTKPKKRR